MERLPIALAGTQMLSKRQASGFGWIYGFVLDSLFGVLGLKWVHLGIIKHKASS